MRVALVLAAALLTGCATPPAPMDRAAWLEMTTRVVDAKPEQAIATAEKVLKLADPKDTRISHRPDGFDAVRHSVTWAVFAFIDDYYHWTVTATPSGQATSLRVSAATTQAATTAAFVAPGVAAPLMTGGAPGNAIEDPKLYALFWSRFESLLGKGPWTTCDEFGGPNKRDIAPALCGIGREDMKP